MIGLSTIGSIYFGWALVAGRKRVPSPAAGKTALRTFAGIFYILTQRHRDAEETKRSSVSRCLRVKMRSTRTAALLPDRAVPPYSPARCRRRDRRRPTL